MLQRFRARTALELSRRLMVTLIPLFIERAAWRFQAEFCVIDRPAGAHGSHRLYSRDFSCSVIFGAAAEKLTSCTAKIAGAGLGMCSRAADSLGLSCLHVR